MQTLFLAKLLAGKLNEAWVALQSRLLRTKLWPGFEQLIEEPHRGHLQELKKYFGGEQGRAASGRRSRQRRQERSDLLYLVRNRFSFHYSINDIERGIDSVLKRPDELVVYLSRSNLNSLYSACDLVSNFSLLQAIAPDDPVTAIKVFLDDLGRVIRLFLSVISGCMWVIVSRHLGTDFDALRAETISVDSPIDGRRFAVPYFVSVDDTGYDGVA